MTRIPNRLLCFCRNIKKKKGDNNYEKESMSSYFRSSNDNEPCSMWII